jgi:ribosome-associated protein
LSAIFTNTTFTGPIDDRNAAKKDIQKLQRAIVDALEDVKAQEIQVFDTEHLSSLFERVIIASGTSNRQTKALAASVRDKVRNAGFGKPRIEGEDNGEWIIVDCGPAVVHVMQPTIRTYYNLEEIWGGTPVRLKFGAPKPAATAEVKGHIKNSVAKKATGKAAAKSTEAKTPAAKNPPSAAKPAPRPNPH